MKAVTFRGKRDVPGSVGCKRRAKLAAAAPRRTDADSLTGRASSSPAISSVPIWRLGRYVERTRRIAEFRSSVGVADIV